MQTGVSWMLYVWFIKPMVFPSASVTGSSTLRAIHSAKLGFATWDFMGIQVEHGEISEIPWRGDLPFTMRPFFLLLQSTENSAYSEQGKLKAC